MWAGAAEAVVAGPRGRPPRLGLKDAAQAGAEGRQVALLSAARGRRWPRPRALSQTTARSPGGAWARTGF